MIYSIKMRCPAEYVHLIFEIVTTFVRFRRTSCKNKESFPMEVQSDKRSYFSFFQLDLGHEFFGQGVYGMFNNNPVKFMVFLSIKTMGVTVNDQ